MHVVHDLDPDDVLNVLGVAPKKIETWELPVGEPGLLTSLARPVGHRGNPAVVLIAARVGGWTFVYDDLGETRYLRHLRLQPPPEAAKALSAVGLVAATASVAGPGKRGFTYAVDGEILFDKADNALDSGSLHLGTHADAPWEVRAAIEAAQPMCSEKDTGASMRMACALAGLPRTLDELHQVTLFLGAPGD